MSVAFITHPECELHDTGFGHPESPERLRAVEKYLPTTQVRILPALWDFAPEILFVSAGFDAHEEAPLAQLRLQEDDYVWVTGKITEVADAHAAGRVVSVLEGGYNTSVLARSIEAHLHAMM